MYDVVVYFIENKEGILIWIKNRNGNIDFAKKEHNAPFPNGKLFCLGWVAWFLDDNV